MAQINPPGIPIERGKIHEFAHAILDDNPLYHDEQAAHDRGFASVVAPPTYTWIDSFFPGPPPAVNPMEGLDMRYLLHGAQEYNFERPIFAGEVLAAEPGEVSTYEKEGRRGGTMKFVESETVYRDERGSVVLTVKRTLIQTAGVVQE